MNRGLPRICVDMDEVIADAVTEHLARYNREFNDTLCIDNMQGLHIWQCIAPERHAALESHLRSHDFFAVLQVMPEAQRVLHTLQQRYEIFIATAAMEVPTSFNAKFEWLARHFPFIPPSHIVFCGDKSILAADYLIDDNPRQLQRFRGQGILYHSHHNIHATRYPRVHNWPEVEAYFLKQL